MESARAVLENRGRAQEGHLTRGLLARPPRHVLDGGGDHVIARGHHRQCLLHEERAFRDFLDLLKKPEPASAVLSHPTLRPLALLTSLALLSLTLCPPGRPAACQPTGYDARVSHETITTTRSSTACLGPHDDAL